MAGIPKLSIRIVFYLMLATSFLFISGCASISPQSKRLAETTSIGASLGIALAYLSKADPVIGAILGGILGFSEGEKINNEIENHARKLDVINYNIRQLERKNNRIKEAIEARKRLVLKLDYSLENLQSEYITNSQECKENYYRYKKAKNTTELSIENLKHKQLILGNKIASIERNDYSYEDQKKLSKLREMHGLLEEYISQLYNIKRRAERVLMILKECS